MELKFLSRQQIFRFNGSLHFPSFALKDGKTSLGFIHDRVIKGNGLDTCIGPIPLPFSVVDQISVVLFHFLGASETATLATDHRGGAREAWKQV